MAKQKVTQAQWIVLQTLNDVHEFEGDIDIVLKNRYHSAAAALVRSGCVTKRDCFPYRPRYQITEAGQKLWSSVQNLYGMGLKNGS